MAAVALAALVTGLLIGSGDGGGSRDGDAGQAAEPRAVERLTLRQQVGQLLVSSFDGTRAPAYMRRRLHAAETAGVILFARNGGTRADWRILTRMLQRAADGGALVAVDQEGGAIRTLPFAGPALAQPAQGDPASVARVARGAGRELRGTGVNVNLAPVADVASEPESIMAGRAFGRQAPEVAARTRAAVRGLWSRGVAAAAKHFPGLGAALVNTDDTPATVAASRRTLERQLEPFRAAVRERVPLVMLSHALYPALDRRRIASQSPAIATGLLRGRLGFEGVIVTDSLEADAVLTRSGVAVAAERSVRAGADLLLMTGSASFNEVFPRLLARALREPAFRRRVERSAARVLALKRRLGLRLPLGRRP